MSNGAPDLTKRFEEWRSQLLDTSKRNPLVSCKFSRGGAIELLYPDLASLWQALVVSSAGVTFQRTQPLLRFEPGDLAGAASTTPVTEAFESATQIIKSPPAVERDSLSPRQLAACRQSRDLRSNAVLTRLSDKALDRRLKRLSVASATSLSERGVNSLFLAYGFLKWFESPDSEQEILSPLVLVPVALSQETVESEWELILLDEEPVPNHPLAEVLKTDFRLALPMFSDETIDDSVAELEKFFDQVRSAVPDRWSVEPTVALGTFAFQKIAMWHDLRENQKAIQENAICRGLAGDDSAIRTSSEPAVTGKDLDRAVPLEAHYLIVDCDSSQLAAVHAVKQGKNLILDGPPGTGKSQTIANIIADCLATSKTVLFVSEKAAALEVVKRRLDKAGIGDFCLECHSHKANKKEIVDELGRCLTLRGEKYPSMDQELADLRRSRDRLNDYAHALHTRQSKLDATPFEVHGRLAQIRVDASTQTAISNPFCIDESALRELCEAVGRLANCRAIIATKGEHAWRGMKADRYSLNLPDDIRFHFSRAAETLGARIRASEDLKQLGFLYADPTLADLDAALAASETALKFPVIPPTWVERGLAVSAERYLALHQHAHSYRILLSGLSAYRGDAVDRTDPELFARAVETGSANSLLQSPQQTVRARAAFFQEAVECLTALISALTNLDTRRATLLVEIGIDGLQERTVAEAERVAQRIAALGGLKSPHLSWFDSSTRQRLRKTTSSAKQMAAMAVATRELLNPRMQQIAFMDVALPQVEAVLQHNSWFKRWGASWRRTKQAFSPLYRAPPSLMPARHILDDAYHLKRFHDFRRELTQTLDSDAAAIGWNGDIDFAWDPLLEQLEIIEALPADWQTAIRARLGSAGRLDGVHLATMAAEVARACEHFRQAAERLAGIVEIERMFDLRDLSQAPLATVSARATAHVERFHAGVTALTAIIKLLEVDQDVEVNQLSDDLSVLDEARSLRSQAVEFADQLGETIEPLSSRQICNVTEKANLAEWTVDFLRIHGGRPPEHVVRVLSDAPTRERLEHVTTETRRANTPEGIVSLSFVRSLFESSALIAAGVDLDALPAIEVKRWLDERVRDADRVSEWVSFVTACANMERLGLATLREEILAHAIPVERAVEVFKQRFFRLWLDEAHRADPALRDFDLSDHFQNLRRFRESDRFWIKSGFARVRQRVLAESPRPNGLDVDAPDNSEVGVLLREVNKKRRHLPIRKLFAAMPTLLLKLKPCVMMSPLSVSTFFSSRETHFDVVIFDEASQIRPHDAVCAIYRGKQLVLAGDQKQLPPTDFFERLADDNSEEDEEGVGQDVRDFESILDASSSLRFPRQRLKWHYRSRRESLIAFSNRHFYNGELITFPSANDIEGSSGVEFSFVKDGRWSGRSEGGVNDPEAMAIAAAVIEHSRQNPKVTLGVITMNQAQQMRVLAEIDARRKGNSDLDPFFSQENPEPFFVKNLENVQGDERDVILLGIGYAKNAAGVLSHNFGPLSRQGGERRMNVAVTRARADLRVFASIVAQDIDLSRTQWQGAKLLRAYLDFAERGPKALGAEITGDSERDFDSDFEREVARALSEKGLDVRRQIGCSGYRVDLALVHPAHRGKYVLGIECDGATYHSFATARDRDRLRQEVLEGLGWRICRIWSTDWIRDPRRQIERVMAEYESSLASGEGGDAGNDSDEPLSVEPEPGRRFSAAPPPSYADIDEVGSAEIKVVIISCLQLFGATPLEDLLQHTSRTLGFQRLGSRIRTRLRTEAERLIEQKAISRGADERLRLGDIRS